MLSIPGSMGKRREADSGLIELVRAERPRLGGRKLFHVLQPRQAYADVSICRDRFFGVLREKSLIPGPVNHPLLDYFLAARYNVFGFNPWIF
jgi:hypothetical protein